MLLVFNISTFLTLEQLIRIAHITLDMKNFLSVDYQKSLYCWKTNHNKA